MKHLWWRLKKFSISMRLLGMTLALLLFVMPGATGCGDESKKFNGSSVDEPIPDDPTSAPPAVVNNLGLYVKIQTDDKFTAIISKGATYNTDCMIANAQASTDQVCTVDVQEGDLKFNGLKFNYNVPPEICDYFQVTPYYYYNYETGYGPRGITLDVVENSGNVSITDCAVETEGGTVAGCTNHLEVSINTSDGALTCVYDHSRTGGTNCCLGDYTLTKNITGDRTATEVTQTSWGGSADACLGGPGKHSWQMRSSNGWPIPVVYYTDSSGLNSTYTVTAPLANRFRDNFSVSNYYHPTRHTHGAFNPLTATTTTMPYAVRPIDDRDGTAVTAGNDAYTFECLDRSFEVKHRIRMYVREWNTYAGFLAFQTSNGVTVNTDTYGYEDGVSCAYGLNYDTCNDARDFDDLLNELDDDLSVTTDTYDTSPGNETERSAWFPDEGAW